MSFFDVPTPVIVQAPFAHFVAADVFNEEECEALLTWLETDAPWRLKVTSFYEQFEFSLLDSVQPVNVQALFSESRSEAWRQRVAEAFGATLSQRRNVTVHRLVPGQRIRIHNDYIAGEETHRVLIQLNRGWSDDQGGALLLFGSDDARAVRKALRPKHNSCVAFRISPDSHHAVTPVTQGERYTLVYSFF